VVKSSASGEMPTIPHSAEVSAVEDLIQDPKVKCLTMQKA